MGGVASEVAGLHGRSGGRGLDRGGGGRGRVLRPVAHVGQLLHEGFAAVERVHQFDGIVAPAGVGDEPEVDHPLHLDPLADQAEHVGPGVDDLVLVPGQFDPPALGFAEAVDHRLVGHQLTGGQEERTVEEVGPPESDRGGTPPHRPLGRRAGGDRPHEQAFHAVDGRLLLGSGDRPGSDLDATGEGAHRVDVGPHRALCQHLDLIEQPFGVDIGGRPQGVGVDGGPQEQPPGGPTPRVRHRVGGNRLGRGHAAHHHRGGGAARGRPPLQPVGCDPFGHPPVARSHQTGHQHQDDHEPHHRSGHRGGARTMIL
jgi:hypothetical protein